MRKLIAVILIAALVRVLDRPAKEPDKERNYQIEMQLDAMRQERVRLQAIVDEMREN